MFEQSESIVCPCWAPWRCVQQSCRRTYLSTLCSLTEVILAHHEARHWRICQKVWSVPEVHSHSSNAIWGSQSGHEPLVVYAKGDGHSWPITRRSCIEKVSTRSYRLLQKMGRGWGLCQHQRQRCLQVRLEKHRLPVRDPTSDCSRQRAIVW